MTSSTADQQQTRRELCKYTSQDAMNLYETALLIVLQGHLINPGNLCLQHLPILRTANKAPSIN